MLIEKGVDFSFLNEKEISTLKEHSDYSTIKDIMVSSGYQPP